MNVRLDSSAPRQGRWIGHVIRFVVGGAITVGAGLLAKAAGPVVGGLVLAVPSRQRWRW